MKAAPLVFRTYSVAGEPGRLVVLTIGKPRPALGDWACRVRIRTPSSAGVAPATRQGEGCEGGDRVDPLPSGAPYTAADAVRTTNTGA
jgi:hypothetical protein